MSPIFGLTLRRVSVTAENYRKVIPCIAILRSPMSRSKPNLGLTLLWLAAAFQVNSRVLTAYPLLFSTADIVLTLRDV